MQKELSKGVPKRRHKMSCSARQELLAAVRKRYSSVGRREKSIILDEACKSTGFHRKHATRALNDFVEKQLSYEKRGRKKIYSEPNFI